jgi:hypothetical protein
MLKTIVILTLALTLIGCGSVPMADVKQDTAAKEFVVPANMAGVYVYRNEFMGGAVYMDISIDGQSIGGTHAKTYLYRELSPGKHTIMSKAENTDTLDVDLKPGTLSFVWQEVKMGIMFARTKLHLVTQEEGKKGVLETKLTTGK